MTKKWDFWNGPDDADRRLKYAAEFRPEYQVNGDLVQSKISSVLSVFRGEMQIELPEGYSSGWRPSKVNEKTSNAGRLSSHLIGAAGDKRDTENADFTWWCMRNPGVLERQQLYMEHPIATVIRAYKMALKEKRPPTPWCHLSTAAPLSHLRCYFPDEASLSEWKEFEAMGGVPSITFAAWKLLKPIPQGADNEV